MSNDTIDRYFDLNLEGAEFDFKKAKKPDIYSEKFENKVLYIIKYHCPKKGNGYSAQQNRIVAHLRFAGYQVYDTDIRRILLRLNDRGKIQIGKDFEIIFPKTKTDLSKRDPEKIYQTAMKISEETGG